MKSTQRHFPAYRNDFDNTANWSAAANQENPLDGGVAIKTVATQRSTSKRGAPVTIDYARFKVGNAWKMLDNRGLT